MAVAANAASRRPHVRGRRMHACHATEGDRAAVGGCHSQHQQQTRRRACGRASAVSTRRPHRPPPLAPQPPPARPPPLTSSTPSLSHPRHPQSRRRSPKAARQPAALPQRKPRRNQQPSLLLSSREGLRLCHARTRRALALGPSLSAPGRRAARGRALPAHQRHPASAGALQAADAVRESYILSPFSVLFRKCVMTPPNILLLHLVLVVNWQSGRRHQ